MSIRVPDGRRREELSLDEQGDVVADCRKSAEAVGVPIAEWLTGAEDTDQLDIAA